MLAGELEPGWKLYAQRWKAADRMKRPRFFNAELEWKGPLAQPPQGKRIAVYAEQGLGDVIQFIRYAPLLQQLGAEVYAVVQPELAALVEHSVQGVQCLMPERKFQVDYHAALLDLPLHLGTTLWNIPAQVPYLRAPANAEEIWRERLLPWEGKLRVGVAWSGSTRQVNNVNRAMRLSNFLPLTQIEGVQCFSLQKADVGALTDVVVNADQLVDLTGHWRDFIDSAAMLHNLDLIVTVDTAIAHLAGAMGKPVWLVLAPNADWRWLLDRDDSPWYPSMRLFRRAFKEARATQMERVTQALVQLDQLVPAVPQA